MSANRPIARPAVIFLGVVLAGVCVLAGFGLASGGLVAWRLYAAPGEPGPSAQTPILATPIQPAPAPATLPAGPGLTPTGGPGLAATATLAIPPEQAGVITQESDLGQPVPSLPGEVLTATQIVQQAPGASPAAAVTATPFPPVAQDPSCIPLNRPTRRVRVVDVIDAVTIEVDDGGEIYRVSYIGAALPENSQDQAVWSAALEANRRLVEDKVVLLAPDRTDVDAVSYRPRYVLVGNVFVNLEMIAGGYAAAAARPPDLSCQSLFQEAQQRASAAQLGLHAPTPTATRILILPPTPTLAVTGPMLITALAKRGTLWQEPEEWVEIRNDSEETIQLEGWTIQDNERHLFTFPAFALGSGQYCRVYTNEYHPNSCGFLYGSPSPIWNNDTDCAYLKDPYGKLISTFCYGYQ